MKVCLVLLVLMSMIVCGCSAQRAQMLRGTRPFCEPTEVTEAETGVRSSYVWHVNCQDGRQLRCGGTPTFGGFTNISCSPEVVAPVPVPAPTETPQP